MSQNEKQIRFVNLETGNTFDGSYPYVFWFSGEQSLNINYTERICFISDQAEVSVSMEKNPVFSLIDPQKLSETNMEELYGFEYHNLQNLIANQLTMQGFKHHNYYIYILYVLAAATVDGEYVCDLTICNNVFKVGATFHDKNENLLINLSNNGIQIPNSIQRALYDNNVHEESIDYIIMNRKWKELLSNYWDVVANKGSYQSLFNSLKWFEYGDKIKMYEFWKNVETGNLLVKEIQELLSDHYSQSLKHFSKTTYIALKYALEQPIIKDGELVLDSEDNPKLERVASKWSIQDLVLKLNLLGNFYETYFMPIHMDLIQTTIEDVVYTNNFKSIIGGVVGREDFIYNCEDIICNVKDEDTFRLDKVQCYVGPQTLFASKYNEGESLSIIGVQRKPVERSLSANDMISDYVSQLYSNIGAIVDFNIQIPLLEGDKIIREILVYKTYSSSNNRRTIKTIVNNEIFNTNTISFSLLCPVEGSYEVRLQFDSIGGKTYTKRVRFNVIDANNVGIKLYRIVNIDENKISSELLQKPCQLNDYVFTRRDGSFANPIQYIPACQNSNDKCVRLNHMMILQYQPDPDTFATLTTKYFDLYKHIPLSNGEEKNYMILISKEFGFDPTKSLKSEYEKIKQCIYREDYIFVPEFHELKPLVPDGYEKELNSYKITDKDTLCVIPSISYGKNIGDNYDWEFINASTGQTIYLSHIKEPFIAPTDKSLLPKGYYNIVFKYSLTNEDKINTVLLDSAFIKV